MKPRLIDEARFVANAGNGGDGAITFRHEKYVRKGGPDGGDGGRGGSIKLVTEAQLSTLKNFAGKDRFKATDGRPGWRAKRKGWDAEDMILKVPVGTVVYVKYPGRWLEGRPFYGEMAEQAQKYGLSPDPAPYLSFEERWNIDSGQWTVDSGQSWVQVADLSKVGDELVLVKGGRGGLGNTHFAHSRLTTPKIAQKGELGERWEVTLELKFIADVGLIGLPNVGKSTLLSLLTAARPEIADYKFTTLSPNLGVLEATSHKPQATSKQNIIMADIPGLIEDASKGKGLGMGFLKHVERCRLLVHVCAPESHMLQATHSGNSGQAGDKQAQELWKNYLTVRQELKAFNETMLEKPELVVVNKVDLVESEQWPVIRKYFHKNGKRVLMTSAVTGEGLNELRKEIVGLVEEN